MQTATLPLETAKPAPFGTVFADTMAIAHYLDGAWSKADLEPVKPLAMHPAAHVLHYSSTCFEGMKAYHRPDGSVQIFRLQRHVARMRQSADLLCLPFPGEAFLDDMIRRVVDHTRASIPEPPGALYIRPTLIGTEENIGAAGAASSEACLFVLVSPVGNYFEGGERPLRILIGDGAMRSTPGFGQAKSGANYAAALRHVIQARKQYRADQVLFCPDGDVQETGASNFMLISDEAIVTKPLNDDFLHGVTRDSVLQLAKRLGYRIEERDFTVAEIFDWIRTGEAALSGTAAVLTGVGTFIHQDREYPVRNGEVGPNTQRLREALTAIQRGQAPDEFDWLTTV